MKSESQNPKAERNPKSEIHGRRYRFGVRPSDFFRLSEFGLRFLLLLAPLAARPDTILASKHDLSASGPGTIKATAESEVCLFCHTPHRAVELPLWNHTLSSANYTPYSSST